MLFILAIITLALLVGPSVSPGVRAPPSPSAVVATPTTNKLFYSVDPKEVEGIVKKGYQPKYAETEIKAVAEESQGSYKLTVQDHFKDDVACAQRIRIYRAELNSKTKKPKWILRDDTFATCEGGHDVKTHSRYRFGYTNAVHFYGSSRTIFRKLDGKGSYYCIERTYLKNPPYDKELSKEACDTKIKRMYTFEGDVRNVLYEIFRYSTQ